MGEIKLVAFSLGERIWWFSLTFSPCGVQGKLKFLLSFGFIVSLRFYFEYTHWKCACTSIQRKFEICKLILKAIAYKFGESHDRTENSDFLLLCQKDPFGELFSEIYFQSSSEFTFLWNLGKFEIQLSQPRWLMENCTFLTRQYKRREYRDIRWLSFALLLHNTVLLIHFAVNYR